jgi:hypothetical protein
MATESGDLHRIGGGSIENLRLKPREMKLHPPGISVLKAPTACLAAMQMKEVFPQAKALHEQARLIGTTTVEKIRSAGFDVIAKPTRLLANHHRIIHPEGVIGFNDDNLKRLSEVFTNTSGHES